MTLQCSLHRHGWMNSHLLLSGQMAAWPQFLAFSHGGISAIDLLIRFCLGEKFLSLFKFMTKKCYVDMAFSDNSPAGTEHVSLPQRLRISKGLPKEVAESSRMAAPLVMWCYYFLTSRRDFLLLSLFFYQNNLISSKWSIHRCLVSKKS